MKMTHDLIRICLCVLAFCLHACDKAKEHSKITTDAVQVIGTTAVVSGFIHQIGDYDPEDFGFCFSTQTQPTVNDCTRSLGSQPAEGAFQDTIDNLSPLTIYYVRAFIKEGEEWRYANILSFQTNANPPIVSTDSVVMITSNTATVAGRVISDGGSPVTDRGVCWDTVQNPTLSSNHTSNGAGTGSFTSFLDGLVPSTLYYVRSYATNAGGTSYAEQLSFTTRPDTGGWSQLSDLPGPPRQRAIHFAISDRIFISTGTNSTTNLSDLWEYDMSSQSWTQRADFIGSPRWGAVCFVIDRKAYVLSGYDGTPLNDVYVYVADSNYWRQLAPFPGLPRLRAIAFSLNGKGYVGTGETTFAQTYSSDMWEYDPSNNTWTQKSDFGGGTRTGAIAFVVGQKAYVGLGVNNFGYYNDLWEYDGSADSWQRKSDCPGPGSSGSVSFSIHNRGFVGSGGTGGLFSNEFWRYSVVDDSWTRVSALPASGRAGAVAGSVGQYGYLLTGNAEVGQLTDFWRFVP